MVCNGLMIKDYDSVKLWPERKLCENGVELTAEQKCV